MDNKQIAIRVPFSNNGTFNVEELNAKLQEGYIFVASLGSANGEVIAIVGPPPGDGSHGSS